MSLPRFFDRVADATLPLLPPGTGSDALIERLEATITSLRTADAPSVSGE